MWIKRDLQDHLEETTEKSALPVQILVGPRQGGKSALFHQLNQKNFREVSLDDLQSRQLAEKDPALFLEQNPPPLFVDEAAYAPNLFPQIKLVIDQARRAKKANSTLFRLTASNQILFDKRVKESLAGRASYFRLHPFSLNELQRAKFDFKIQEFLFKGGWPELYVNSEIDFVSFLNDYIQTYVEKDVAMVAGIEKLGAFQTVLGLLAARTGQIMNFDSISRDAGVTAPAIKDWILILERASICGLLRPYASNLNKRLIRAPKFYFLDTGLACRLQGHQNQEPMMKSPQVGPLFETLVLSEIIKTRDHHRKTWQLFYWRTKDMEEYDFIISNGQKQVILDAQLSIQSAKPIHISKSLRRDFPSSQLSLGVVTFGGSFTKISTDCWQIPVTGLATFLLSELS